MMLEPDDFPLKVIGTLIYARMRSSPVLTADTPQVAKQVTAALNNLDALRRAKAAIDAIPPLRPVERREA